MTRTDPLPFRIHVPGDERVGLDGIREVVWKIEGLLHLDGTTLVLEWTGSRTTTVVSLGTVRKDTRELPVSSLDVPAGWLSEVRLRAWWWPARLHLRARVLDAFEGVPAARPGAITLRLRWRDLALARQVIADIQLARADAALIDAGKLPGFTDTPRLGGPSPAD